MLRAGICGAGFIARAHSHGYLAHPDLVRVVRVVDPRIENASQLAIRHNAEVGGDFAALLADDIDVVSICTPTPTHAELTIAALRAGKHVLCEKPIALTLAEAEAMIAAADEADRILMIGHVTRYEDDYRRAREIVQAGEIGDLRMASQAITGPFPTWSAGGWFADPLQSGGPILDLAIHGFDFLNWVFESPVVRVSTVGAHGKLDFPANTLTTLRFANGGMALVEASWTHPEEQGLTARAELMGTSGRIAWDYGSIAALEVVGKHSGAYQFTGEIWAAEIGGFLRAVRDGAPSPIPGSVGLAALRVGLAAIASLESGRTIDPRQDGQGQGSV